jgi:hypothetical protein
MKFVKIGPRAHPVGGMDNVGERGAGNFFSDHPISIAAALQL